MGLEGNGMGVRRIKRRPPRTKAQLLFEIRKRVAREGPRTPWADPQSAAVYGAEHYGDCVPESKFRSHVEILNFVNMVRSSKTWRKRWYNQKPVVYKSSPSASYAWGGHAWSRARGKYPHLSYPNSPEGRALHVILHELAHCITGPSHGHDRVFIGVLLKLVHQFEGAWYAKELRRRFIQTGALPRKKRK